MNILYGVSGEGFGHASHAIVVANFLQKKGHKVIIATYGQAYELLKDKFNVILINGFNLIYNEGILRHRKSFFYNAKPFLRTIKHRKKLKEAIKNFKPDLCISDMEPIVSFLSYFYHIPLISLSNQNRFVDFKINVPKKYLGDFLIAKIIIKLFSPWKNYSIALSFSKLKQIKKNSYIASPIIREDIRNLKFNDTGPIIVYLTKRNESSIRALKKSSENYIVYGYDINKKEDNLHFKTRDFFLNDFVNCKAFISNSGFTSVGEAFYLKKPYFAIPLKGQFEQLYNALYIQKNGLGHYAEKLTLDNLNYFLSHLEVYKKNLIKHKFSSNEAVEILDRLLEKIRVNRK